MQHSRHQNGGLLFINTLTSKPTHTYTKKCTHTPHTHPDTHSDSQHTHTHMHTHTHTHTRPNAKMRTGLTDSWTHRLIPEMKIALILADVEHTFNIKWASRAAVCSWESMNSGKTFCQTLMNALQKRRCCHKCCECMECTSRGSVPQSSYMHTASCRITALLS